MRKEKDLENAINKILNDTPRPLTTRQIKEAVHSTYGKESILKILGILKDMAIRKEIRLSEKKDGNIIFWELE